jgi:hypothetical protein
LDLIKQIEESEMKLKFVVLVFCLFFVGSMSFAATYYIPQVAIGVFEGANDTVYSYRTTFVFFNNQSTFTNVALSLTDQAGAPMLVNIPGVVSNSSTFSFQLGPGATKIMQTDSAGNARVGAATVTTDLDIGVSGIYTINNETQQKFVTEVGVKGGSQMTSFVVPVQTTANGQINTGLALYNPGTSSATVDLTLKTEDGTSAGNASFSLAAGAQTAFYVGNKIDSVNNTTFSGTLTVSSSAAIAAVALRQNSPSFDTFTSIPVVPTTSTQTAFNLAHVVDGNVGGTPYTTTFMLFNFGTASASVTLAPTKGDGTAWPLTMTDASTTAGTYTIPAGGSKFLVTNGTANDQGAVKITSTAKIGAAALFTEYNNDQSFNTEAGVQDSPAFTDFTLPIDSRVSLDGTETTSDTGIAFFNPGTSSVTFTPSFLDAAGVITPSTTSVTIPAKGHTASFFNQLFPLLGDIQGSVAVSGLSSGISAMTLRLNMVPFSMTTLPVVTGVAPGVTPATAGTPTRKKLGGVIATADTTVNAKLPYGYTVTITPTITGATVWSQYGGLGVRALSAGNTYTTTSSGANYTANLPPGNYQFSVESYVGGQSTAFFSFYTSNVVQITGNATVPIAVAFPTLYTVTGSVSGTSTTAGMFVLSDVTGSGSYGYGVAGGSTYSIPAPAGTYQISYAANWQAGAPYVSNLGTVTIVDANITGPDIVVPPTSVNLSGTVQFPDAPPTSTTIMAKNTKGVNAQAFAFDTRTVTATSAGTYLNLPLTPGDSYGMSLAYSVGTMSTAGGINCGGSATGTFLADAYYSGGATMTTAATINTSNLAIPAPAAVFASYRYWSSTTAGVSGTMYTIPNLTPGKTYTVTLFFADAYTAAGGRVFDITLNGQTVESSFDIAATAGKAVAIDKSYSVAANSSGQIIIGYITRTGSPKMDGFTVQGGLEVAVSQGTVSYTPPLDNPISVNSDATYDFTTPVPAVPSMVTISGKVTDTAGTAVSGATVSATSSQLTGATTGASFTSTNATTATDGTYSLKVLPGRRYTLTITK